MDNQLKIVLLHKDARMPIFSTDGAAGMDICACEPGVIPPGKTALVSTGIIFQIPEGMVGILKERSGLAIRNAIAVCGGVIDCDFRSETKVILRNLGDKDFEYKTGDRIAQMLIVNVFRLPMVKIESHELTQTKRGANGFGSTGISSEEGTTSKKRKTEEQ